MSYRNYVIAAYAIFIVVLSWDFIAPRLRIARLLRAAKRQAARRQATTPSADTELQR